jgi:hypothetical protein
VTNLRLLVVLMAGLLLLVGIPPFRRRMPGLRDFPVAAEVLLWLGLVSACLAAFARAQTVRSTELIQTAARAAFEVGKQVLASLLRPPAVWASTHELLIGIVTVGLVGLGCVVAAERAVTGVRRAVEPRPHLGDWWEVKLSRGAPPSRVQPTAAAASSAFMDAHSTALHLGVSRPTAYHWAHSRRLACTRAPMGLRFNSRDLAALPDRRIHVTTPGWSIAG